ncbi:MAG: AAA family ATPase [Alphaproteobacteria bacterium]|jgi:AAA+ ATPase superfamily predicted ATPase|nr:AAA family ATPase [Alphaproteobacteria bacterium]MBP9877157.1 AAA family ATPase [Alphaproteobacteria bacterium]
MTNFIGRETELEEMKRFLHKKTASLIVIKGRRRIGKSRLIEEFGKNLKMLSFIGLPPTSDTTAQDQRDDFSLQLSRIFKTPPLKGDDWSDLFYFLAQQTQKGKVVISLDEISWMGSKDPNFLGKLKSAWDQSFKKNNQLILILCGSVSSWIDENILSSTAFLGRISFTLGLEELSLQDCNKFWNKSGARISAYEKLKILSVTGGVPRYLEEIDPSQPAEFNIKQLCFKKGGLLTNEFEKVFSDLFSSRSKIYKDIINCLVDGPADIQTICDVLEVGRTGLISSYLEDLVKASFLSRDYTWSAKTGKPSFLSRFRLSDNYVRFYLKSIEPNLPLIEAGRMTEQSLYNMPGWNAMMGLQFQNLVLHNRSLIQKKMHIRPEDIVIDNPYFQRKTSTKRGCQVDYMIQTKFNNLFVCEIKFSKNEVGLDIIQEMEERLSRLKLPRGFSYWPVLIHVNGVSDRVEDSGYFAKIIDFGEFLAP